MKEKQLARFNINFVRHYPMTLALAFVVGFVAIAVTLL